MKCSNWQHPNYEDYNTGHDDGAATNAYYHPYDRKRDALAAYNQGYQDGQAAYDEYLNDQENAE